MSFVPLTIGSESFNQIGPGKYLLSTVAFGDALDYILVKGGTFNRTTGLITCSVSQNFEVQQDPDDSDSRILASVQTIIQVPRSVTVTDIDLKLKRTSDFLDNSSLGRLLHGES